MAAMPLALDFTDLLKGIPAGAWVAISERKHQVISYGAELKVVMEEARERGENNPLVLKVPNQSEALLF